MCGLAQKDLIITHDGHFHADEVLACMMLQKINFESQIHRTRDSAAIESYINTNKLLAAVDVFGVYDHSRKLYDHHQKGFATFINGVKCSSLGLIWLHYSHDIVKVYFPRISFNMMELLIKQIYLEYIRSIDATDNGIDIVCEIELNDTRNSLEKDLHLKNDGEISPNDRYTHVRSISEMVRDCNKFEEAIELVTKDFDNFMGKHMVRWVSGYNATRNAFDEKNTKNKNKHSSITEKYRDSILLTHKAGNLGEFICTQNNDIWNKIVYTIDEQNKGYNIYAVPLSSHSKKTRKPLLEQWRGLRDDDLINESKISGCRFVHSNGFMGQNITLEGALEMCYKSIDALN